MSPFSAIFPVPFRVLALVGLGGLCWATNLHLLDYLGIDSGQALQVPHYKQTSDGAPVLSLPSHSPSPRVDTPSPTGTPSSYFPALGSIYAHPSSLYPALYRILLSYLIPAGGGWVLFYWLTRGNVETLNAAKWVPAICYVVLIVAAVIPLHNIYGAQRSYFYKCVRPP